MKKIILLLAPLFLSVQVPAQSPSNLERNFLHPPNSARPWVYWFPLDGNISSNGITADLEAMKRVGIGGVLYMETDQGAPKGPALFAGPLWRQLFKHICAEANRLGLEVNMNNDAGWCGSGGPWITPALAMQKLVWTETPVQGPSHFDAVLPQPAAVAGYYRDIAVFAFPTPADYRIGKIQGKSALTKEEFTPGAWYDVLPAEKIIERNRIVELTARLGKDGRLAWEAPQGNWTLLRLGHTPTGANNAPSPMEGRGLECDKFSKEAAEAHFNGLMAKLIADSKPLVPKTLVSTHIDSWEVGSQNWTPKFRAEFQRLRGYDPLTFLPVMTGRVVDSLEVSERFLWDVRQTVSDLLVDNYAGHFRKLAHRHGMRLSIEAYDGVPCDDIAYAGRADEPMAEFWSWSKFGAAYSCTEMSGAAHVYGKRILGAEAFTATDAEKWMGHPANVKDLGDWAFCEGINRFVFHRYALQPWTNPDRPPGMSMGPWGLHYERTQTWWEQSKAWHEYLARCQFLLQQGLFVADICYLEPERSPQRFQSPTGSIDRPPYNFDGCTPEVVMTRMKAKGGRLVLPDGMSYRLMVLPRVETMTPQLLGKIKDLVKAGATVVGPRPLKSPSLSDYPKCDLEVKRLADELWGEGSGGVMEKGSDGKAAITPALQDSNTPFLQRPFGKGQVYSLPDPDKKRESTPGAKSALSSATWIWHREGNPAVSAPPGKRFFRRLVTLDAGSAVESARLVMTVDNSFECWVNGRRAGAGDNFKQAYEMNIASLLKPGANIIAVEAVNATDLPNPAGFICALNVKYRDGRSLELRSDKTWQTAITAPANWMTDTAAAEGWSAAMELGPLGLGPWGDIDQAPSGPGFYPDFQVIAGMLQKLGVPPDFESQANPGKESLRYIHRVLGAADVYFVANKTQQPEEAVCSFRVGGKQPELWWPDTGRTERVAVYDEAGGVTRMPLRLDPSGSVFVVFRQNSAPARERVTTVTRNGEPVLDLAGHAQAGTLELARARDGKVGALVRQAGSYALKTATGQVRGFTVASIPDPLEITGAWDVRFPPNWGAPDLVTLDKLISWSDHSDPGVKYFSGTAAYSKRINIPPTLLAKDRRVYLDLGKVQVMAEVKLNGRGLGILWKPPFRVDITEAAQTGENLLELRVVNLWINRQIGDEQLPEDSQRNPNGTLKAWPQWLQSGQPSPAGRYTFTSWRLWKKDAPLQESGLLGPVTLSVVERVTVTP